VIRPAEAPKILPRLHCQWQGSATVTLNGALAVNHTRRRAGVTVTNLKALEPDHRWTMRREHHKSVQS
jgi:hypothetical protein